MLVNKDDGSQIYIPEEYLKLQASNERREALFWARAAAVVVFVGSLIYLLAKWI